MEMKICRYCKKPILSLETYWSYFVNTSMDTYLHEKCIRKYTPDDIANKNKDYGYRMDHAIFPLFSTEELFQLLIITPPDFYDAKLIAEELNRRNNLPIDS